VLYAAIRHIDFWVPVLRHGHAGVFVLTAVCHSLVSLQAKPAKTGAAHLVDGPIREMFPVPQDRRKHLLSFRHFKRFTVELVLEDEIWLATMNVW
jgi:hypothetical protein